MTRVNPSGPEKNEGLSPQSPVSPSSFEFDVLRDIDCLPDDLKEKIARIHTAIMNLPEEREYFAMLDIISFFEGYDSLLNQKADCADDDNDREMLLSVKRKVEALANNWPDDIKKELLVLFAYVVRYESGTLIPKAETMASITEIESNLRVNMLKDLMGAFISPYQTNLSAGYLQMSSSADSRDVHTIQENIDTLRTEPGDSILGKIRSRTEQNLTRTALEGITSAHWKLFASCNEQKLKDFEEAFQLCVDGIIEQLQANSKYEVGTALDEFMEPYVGVEARTWSSE